MIDIKILILLLGTLDSRWTRTGFTLATTEFTGLRI